MLSRENRLKKNKEFNFIYKKGKFINSSNFTLIYVDTYLKRPKFGISVSKKIGNSVMRSRTKRVLSEIIRLIIDKLAVKNYVVVLKPDFSKHTYSELETEFLKTLKKAGLLKNESDV